MTRRDFKLGAPYREILSSDSAKPFENELFRECDVLADLVTKNIGNSHVIVYDRSGDVLSFMWFYDNDPYFYIEFVATNRKFRSGLRPSSKLIILLEEIGVELNYEKIELWALEDTTSFYQDLGFEFVGNAITGNYGIMSKMTKSLG